MTQSATGDRSRRARDSERIRLAVLGVLLAASGLFVLVQLGPRYHPAPTLVGVLVVLLLFGVAESTQIHVEIRRQTVSVSVSEVPLVLGLFLIPPFWIVLARCAAAAVLFAFRRTSPLKVLVNLGLFAAEVGAATTVFWALAAGDGTRVTDWAAAFAAVLVTNLLGTTVVLLAIGALQGRPSMTELGRVLPLVLLAGALNTTVALVALVVLRVPLGGFLLVVLLVSLIAGYRAYDRLLRQHRDLGQLFAFTQRVGSAQDVDEVQARFLVQTRELMQAETATLRLPSQAQPALNGSATDAGEAGEERGFTGPLVIPQNTRDRRLRAWLARNDLRDALLVPMRDGGDVTGVLQVGNRLGAMSTFTAADLTLLQTLVAHAEVIQHNGRLLEKLRHDAYHDDLTDLPNRAHFLLRLGQRLGASTRPACVVEGVASTQRPSSSRAEGEGSEVQGAVLLLDLDRFKEVNDTLGHHVGDMLLRQVAVRLVSAVSPSTLVARLGGDEFALLVSCSGADEAVEVAKTVKRALTGLFDVSGTSIEVGVSVGVALFPPDGDTALALLQHADVAMYAAKGSPIGISRYRTDDERVSLSRLALAGELRRAVDTGQLTVHYQPKVSARTGAVVGYEALVRWAHPHRGLLLPEEFVPVAEHTGLVGALTRDVLGQALRQCRDWLRERPQVGVAVNLSPRGLLEPNLPQDVADLLAKTGVPAHLLTLEITESAIMADLDTALLALHTLRDIGVTLSVDDFGTGHSSLAYLQRLPVDEVKIDRSFVVPMSVSPKAAAIARAIVELAHTLGLRVVAEGVEDDLSRHTLCAAGCDVLQGYLLSPPLSPAQLDRPLRAPA